VQESVIIMNWTTKAPDCTVYKTGDVRTRKVFAWLPIGKVDGFKTNWFWLQHVTLTERYYFSYVGEDWTTINVEPL
jgi:hypothetical protein